MPAVDPLPRALVKWLTAHPSAPAITYYGEGGTRIELSAASTANAVNKAVNLLTDELLLEQGDVVRVDLPCHWQTPILAVAAWAAGLTLDLSPEPDGGAAATLAAGEATRRPPIGIGLAVSTHPWGLPLGEELPPGWEDTALLTRGQADSAAYRWPGNDQPWVNNPEPWTSGALERRCQELAAAWGLPQGGRLLSSRAPDTLDGLLGCCLVPALAGGGIILNNGADPRDVSRQEGNHATLCDV